MYVYTYTHIIYRVDPRGQRRVREGHVAEAAGAPIGPPRSSNDKNICT